MIRTRTVLITGGAGFIGWHLVPAIAQIRKRVVVVDSWLEQVHGPTGAFLAAVAAHAE